MRAALSLMAGLAVLLLAAEASGQPPRGDRRSDGERGGGDEGRGRRDRGPPDRAMFFQQGGPPGGGSFGGPPGGGPYGGGPFGGGPFGGPPGGGPFGGPPGRGPGGSPDDAAARAERFQSFLARFDTNGDGVISPNEIDPNRRPMFDGMMQRMGLDPSKPIPVSALRDAAMRNMQQRSGGPPGGGPGGTPSPGSRGAATASLVPGFGTGTAPPPVAGFGPPPAVKSTSSVASPSASGTVKSPMPSPSPGSPNSAEKDKAAARVRQFAEIMMKQYDKNKNGVLDGDEIGQLREGLRDADRDRDGRITVDELAVKLAEYSQRRGGPGSDRGRGPGGGQASDPPKFHRFLTAQERLPAGLPDWFRTSDTNQDGQVSMAEYAKHKDWSQVAETFATCDLNNDGIITPAECLAVEKARKK